MKNYEAREAQITGKTADGEWLVRAEDAAGFKPGVRLWIQPFPTPSAALKQKKMLWALIYEISRWQKESPETVSRQRKLGFLIGEMQTHAIRLFSISDAPQELTADFQRYLVRFVIEHGIITKKPLIAYTDDMDDYMACCMERKKCAVCGREATLIPLEEGGLRLDADVITLCGEHAGEMTEKGAAGFMKKYHFKKGLPLDRDMARKYAVKMGGEDAR